MRKTLLCISLLLGLTVLPLAAEEGVATVGDITYLSLSEAIAAANQEEEVDLLVSTMESVTNNKPIILNLNGNTLSVAEGSGIRVADGVAVTINDGTITGATDSGIYIENGTVTLNNLTIIGNNASMPTRDGGGVNIDAGSLTINSSLITGNSAADGGGGIAAQAGTNLILNNVTVSDNISNEGGGIYLTGNTGNITNSIISHNQTRKDNQFAVGGGIYVGTNTYVSINGSTLENNYAEEQGGAICNYGGTLELSGSTLITNYANYGGAIMGYIGNIIVNNDTLITNNNSNYGGGIFSSSNNLTIADGAMIYNNIGITAAADIYSYGGSLCLGAVGSNLILAEDNENIDGWYLDYSPRWSTDFSVVANNTAYGIKAAHAFKEYSSYTVAYVDKENNLPTAEEKIVDKIEVGTQITEEALILNGYTLISDAIISITIGSETNSIIFYYNINKKVPTIEPTSSSDTTPTVKPVPTSTPKSNSSSEVEIIEEENTPQAAQNHHNYVLVRTDCKAEAFN